MAPPMRKLLLQLDSSRLPSVFDQVVAYASGNPTNVVNPDVLKSEMRRTA